ncbi:MAG: nitroreductase family protein [Acidimicrobiia bacterium]
MTIPAFIHARRSIRQFAPQAIATADIDTCIAAALCAPAPHHTQPWRWVTITDLATKQRFAEAMGARWRIDLERDHVDAAIIERLIVGSIARLADTPALVLGCLTRDGLDTYPDAERTNAEWGMALLSLGAAVENFMLTASHLDLASCWVAAPIFCPDVCNDALQLDATWIPQALLCVGYPDASYVPRARTDLDLDAFRVMR